MNKYEWEQTETLYCPSTGCQGMLLSNPLYHQLKCSDCGKYFFMFTEFAEDPEFKEDD